MASPFLTAEDLAAFQNQVQATDPFTTIAKTAGSWQPNTSTWSPTELGVSSLLQGFLGGFGGGASQQRALNQTQTVMGMLPQLSTNPMGTQMPQGIDPLAFQALQQKAAVNKQAQDAAEAQQLKQALLQASLSGLTRKSEVIGEQEGWQAAFANEQKFREELAKQQQKEVADKLVPIEGVKSLEETLPVNEKNPYNAAQIKLQERLAQQAKENLQRATEDEKTYYGRIVNSGTFTQYLDIKNNFDTMLALKDDDSISGSIQMISALARIADPAGTVKEGEYKLNANAQSFLDAFAGNWRSVVDGKGPLSPKAKQSMINAAARKYNAFGENFETLKNTQYSVLRKKGGDPENIPIGVEFAPYEIKSTYPGSAKAKTVSPAGVQGEKPKINAGDVEKIKALMAKSSREVLSADEDAYLRSFKGLVE